MIHQMLKHMLTQTSSLPATPAAAKTLMSTTTGGTGSVTTTGPNFKLASRANNQLMLEEATANLEDMSLFSPTARSNNHANLTLNQSIYANTVALPKMNGGAVRHGSNGSNGSSTKSGNGLNTSKLSSSNSPATTNQTKTSYMDSSRDHSHHELENTQLSPITRSSSNSTSRPLPNGFLRSNQSSSSPPPLLTGNRFSHTSVSQERDQSLLRPPHMNSTMHNKSNLTSLNASTNTQPPTTSMTKKVLNASALVPANVSKFMLLSKEAGVRVTITSLGLLCLVSLLLALLSLVFLLKITPAEEKPKTKYQFDFLSPSKFTSLYEVTLSFCALTLVLNLCCLLVCTIQFLFAVKLVKSPHGRHRTSKYLKGAASTRICAIGGFFLSIPLFLTGVILYTFLHFDSTPAIVSSVVIGLGIVFCGAAVVHNVFVWQKEKTAQVSKSGTNSPVLSRTQQNILDATSKTAQTLGGLPQATLDLSGPNSRVLELSTLV